PHHHQEVPPMTLTAAEIERRMAAATTAEERGQHREAAGLYDQLGREIQDQFGRSDSRALDAFEGMACAVETADGESWFAQP
ncbi:hypothetical protein, partial [Streptomyces sp. NPDC002067]